MDVSLLVNALVDRAHPLRRSVVAELASMPRLARHVVPAILKAATRGKGTLLEAALASDDPSMRPQALGAVAMSGQLPVARWLLAGIDDKRLRPDEQRSFLPGVLASRPTARLGYDWMRANLDTLMGGSGGIFYASKLPDWLGRFCSVAMSDEFASDLRPRFKGRTGELGLERAIARVRNCGVLRDQRGTAISADFAVLK